MIKNIYLTGFMGSGKSKIGHHLAENLGMEFVDTDDVIESKYKKTITDIFDQLGEIKFREIEEEILNDLIKEISSSVFALGGGSLLSKRNLDRVKETGLLIYIKSSLEQIWDRTKNKTKRPLLLINGEFPTKTIFMDKAILLLEARTPGYNNSKVIIDRDGKEAEEVVEEILAKINI